MDTRTPDDLVDERLRAAGARLRLESPSPAVTESALAAVNRRGRPSRPLRWVVPIGIVAAAAAALGVLTLSRGTDEAEPEVPAVTPPVTAAPTVPATTTPSPVFAGDPPLSASAAAFGCPGTLGEIAAAITSPAATITALECSGDDAEALSGELVISFHQFDGGPWREVGRMSAEGCGAPCLETMLPVPPESLLVRDLGDLNPVDVTRQVRRHRDLVQVSEPEQWARALGARLADGQDPAPTVNVEVVDGADIFLITLSGLGDDSIGEVTYVVWYDSSPPVPTVERAFLISRCSRGVAVDEAGEPMDLCL
jgi:hypothetical protein